MLSKQARRAIGGAATVGALCAAIAVIGVATNGGDAAAQASFSGRAYAEQLIGGGVADDGAFEEMPTAIRDVREAPPWVAEEVADLADAEEVRATDDWSTIGFSREGAVSAEYGWLEEQLMQRGWTLAKTGVEGTATGVKEGGRCSWLWFGVTDIGGKTCFVIQVLAR